MAPLAPLGPTYSPHAPTQELINALAERGWMLVSTEDIRAVLYHPERKEEIVVVADPDDPSRIRYASINGRPTLVQAAIEHVRQGADYKPRLPCPLRPRQRQVLRMMTDGLTRDEVADRLHIDLITVNTHIHNAKQAANVATTIRLIALCERNGWLDETLQSPGRRRGQPR